MSEIKNIPVGEINVFKGSHNTEAALSAIKESIKQYGIQQPITVDENNTIVTGNGVYKAAVSLGYTEIPCIVLKDLTDDELRQYRIADNLTGAFATWNEKKLKYEISCLQSPQDLQYCFDEDLTKMVSFMDAVPQVVNPKKPQKSVQEKEKDFKNELKNIESDMKAKPREYQEYICSSCGKKVIIKV